MADLTLYFHRDFDGVASAALVLRWLREAAEPSNTQLRTIQYGRPWRDIRLQKPCAVVDFHYHLDATYYWDHHASSFMSDEWERDFQKRKDRGDRVWWDAAEPSCASLIARTIPSLTSQHEVRDLVDWATVIDAARYRSVEQVFASEEPALQIDLALVGGSDDLYTEVARLLANNPLARVAESPLVQGRFAEARKAQRRELEYFESCVRYEEGIVSADASREVLRFSRYAPYHFARDAVYSVVLSAGTSRLKVLCMRNPWLEFESMDLGALCQRYGGGGHRRVGAVAFLLHDEERAQVVLEELRAALAQHAASVHQMTSEPV